MGASAIIPAAPVLLENIDRTEPQRIAQLRGAIHEVLRTEESWALPIPTLPPVAGLGGWGIDRGIETSTGRLLTGSDWVDTVESLTDEERQIAEAADPAIIIALLHAHAADVAIGPLGSSENLLLPLDLSGAATANAPLAPVDGAADFDVQVVEALTGGASIAADVTGAETLDATSMLDTGRLLELSARAEDVHSDLTVLGAGIRYLNREDATLSAFDLVFDEPIHEVRSICGTATWTRAAHE
jgi:hypothetical protein